MSLRINANIPSLQAQREIKKADQKLSKSLEKLASGQKISKGDKDIVNLVKSEAMRSDMRGITSAMSNIASGRDSMEMADGAMSEMSELAQQIREKLVQGADSSISSQERQSINSAITDLKAEFERIASETNYDGQSLLNGNFTNKLYQVGSDSGEVISVSINDMRATDAMNQVSATTAEEASESINDMDDIISNLSSQRAEVGSKVQSFESADSALMTKLENTAKTEQNLRDVDVAEEVANKTAAEIKLKMSVAVQAHANAATKSALTLLGG